MTKRIEVNEITYYRYQDKWYYSDVEALPHYYHTEVPTQISSLLTALKKRDECIATRSKLLLKANEDMKRLLIALNDKRKKVATLTEEQDRLREVLEEVDKWDLRWADGLDSNVARIKGLVHRALTRKEQNND